MHTIFSYTKFTLKPNWFSTVWVNKSYIINNAINYLSNRSTSINRFFIESKFFTFNHYTVSKYSVSKTSTVISQSVNVKNNEWEAYTHFFEVAEYYLYYGYQFRVILSQRKFKQNVNKLMRMEDLWSIWICISTVRNMAG